MRTTVTDTTMRAFTAPASVAVVGVGRRAGGVGRAIFDNLVAGGFPGALYAVNPAACEIDGYPCHPTVADLPETPELVIIAIPAADVGAVIDACGSRGCRAAIVVSAGFKETGPAGAALERDVAERAARHGVRVLGPNCLGLIVPRSRLNASFAVGMPPAGPVAVISQSGALGTAVLDWSRAPGRGVSAFASLGNRVDVSEADLIEAFVADPATRVIAGYIESVADGARFVESAGAVSRTTPIVLLKAGGSDAGARAVSSHTGSLAGSDAAYDAAFRAAGVVRAHDMEDLFGLADALARQPVPGGPGVVVLTNAGGPAIMATDACERLGVALSSLERETVDALREALPAGAALYNPVDVLGDAGAERYADALRILGRDPGVRAVLVLLTPQAPTRPLETARAIADAAASSGITTLACFMGDEAVAEGRRELLMRGIPSYDFPERAVAALSGMEAYRAIRSRPPVAAPIVDADRATVAEIIEGARAARRAFITDESASRIAAAYGIPVPAFAMAATLKEAVEGAERVGYPVVLKVASPDVLHKSDVGGIVLDIAGADELAAAWESVMSGVRRRMPDAAISGALIQRMVPPGREVIVGINRDPAFGPLVMFGLGGIYVEVLKDVVFRLCPVAPRVAVEMISGIRAYGLLRGARGQGPADIDALADLIWRVSALAADFPQIVELDVNPLIVADKGCGAVAADIRIGIGG